MPKSFRCNENLWEAFKQETKANSDTVCSVLEALISGYLTAAKHKVYKSSTLIENLVVQRVIRKHRRVAHEVEKSIEIVGSLDKCADCNNLASYELSYKKEELNCYFVKFLCQKHFKRHYDFAKKKNLHPTYKENKH